jgi:nitroreductase
MIIPAIQKRRSVREYQDKAVSDEDINEIIKAAQYAPTGRNNRLVEFIVIKDQATKEKLFELTGRDPDQDFVVKAPVILIMVSNMEKNDLYKQDLSIASGYVFLQAAELGLGTVWKNIWPDQTGVIKKLLGIPEEFTFVNMVPIGYPETPPEPHNDNDYSEKKIHKEKW